MNLRGVGGGEGWGFSAEGYQGKGLTGLESMLGDLEEGLRKHGLALHWYLWKVQPILCLGNFLSRW